MEVFTKLQDEVIPKFAELLNSRNPEKFSLLENLHLYGINVRL
jgi:hypothetical protein